MDSDCHSYVMHGESVRPILEWAVSTGGVPLIYLDQCSYIVGLAKSSLWGQTNHLTTSYTSAHRELILCV